MRPCGYLPGFLYPEDTIRSVLDAKVHGRAFPKCAPRQNGQYWWKGLKYQCLRFGLEVDFHCFIAEARRTHRMYTGFCLKYRATPVAGQPPYLRFALTQVRSP